MNPFSKWKLSDVALFNRRVSESDGAVDDGPERDLHAKIFDECRRRGWIALHGAMSERTHRTAGEWDFTILADNGRVLFVECKSCGGKLSADQRALIAWAYKLGHQIHVVRSFSAFMVVITDETKQKDGMTNQ